MQESSSAMQDPSAVTGANIMLARDLAEYADEVLPRPKPALEQEY